MPKIKQNAELNIVGIKDNIERAYRVERFKAYCREILQLQGQGKCQDIWIQAQKQTVQYTSTIPQRNRREAEGFDARVEESIMGKQKGCIEI